MNDQWTYWQNAVAAGKAHTDAPKGYPASGFYRRPRGQQREGLQVYRSEEDGAPWCVIARAGEELTAPASPDPDKLCERLASMEVVSADAWTEFRANGRWPDEIEATSVDHVEDAPAHERIKAEIEAIAQRAKDYLASLPNGINTDDENATVAAYAAEIAAREKLAAKTHKEQKEPHLLAGREVDRAWKPVIDLGESTRKAIVAPTTAFRQRRAREEDDRRRAEEARQRAEQERIRAENAQRAADAAAAGRAPESAEYVPPPPVTLPPKKATGLRTFKEIEIVSLQELAMQIATMNDPPPQFAEVCKTIARKWLADGVPVKGARLVEVQRAA